VVSVSNAWNRFWFTGYSGASLGLLRLCFGLGLFFFNLSQLWALFTLDPTGEPFYYVRPVWYFQWLGFTHNLPMLDFVILALCQVAILCMAFGYRTRLSTIVSIVLILYLRGVRDSFLGEGHHRWHVPFQILLFLALSHSGAAYSLDARRALREGRQRVLEEWEASWPIVAMQVYTASFYFWSVIAKVKLTGWNWFFDPRRIQDLLLERSMTWGVTATGEPLFNPLPYWLSQQETLCQILGVGTLVMEAGFPVILLIRQPMARLAFLSGVSVFHVANFVFAYVGFVLFPINFVTFFDLEAVRRRLAARCAAVPAPAAAD
jgi:hypothetical protein